jgi:hypothetical protein
VRRDRWPVAVLVGVPLVAFVVPALLGHPAIAGDNAIQNFPLRVLVGRDVAHGQIPLWDPLLWSGTPLLGGLNAGAANPLTLAFAVLPPVAAWILGLLAVYWAAGLGMYALVRQLGARPLAALLAALTYAYAGAMAGQMVHVGVVQGMALVPWLLLAGIRLSGAVLGGRGSAWPWVALLAATVGLTVLTGEPRAMVEVEVVGTLAVLWLVLRPRPSRPGVRRRLLLAALALLGAAWGAAIAAVQAVVGWGFINGSQRASESYRFFGSGSLHPAWSALLLVPDLFGGDGVLHQPGYFMPYNLAEVTGYVGLVPLVAVAGLLVARRGREWVPWLVLAGVGLVLAWGSFTPLGHLLVHVPLLGRTRLQSRNLGITDLALAVLLGLWAERALGTHPEGAGLGPGRRWAAAAPALAAAALCVAGLVAPAALEGAFGAAPSAAGLGRYLSPWFVAQLAVAAAVVGVVLGWRRLGPAARRRWLTTVVVVDVGLFALSSSTGLTDGHVEPEPSPAAAVAVLGSTGRFALYDTVTIDDVLDDVGQPDLNVFTGLPSVQGYGSILSGRYGRATGTHTLDRLSPCALADGTFDQVRLASLLVLPTAVAPAVPRGAGAPPAPPACPGVAARRTSFTLGRAVGVVSAHLVGAAWWRPAAAPRGRPSGPRRHRAAAGRCGWRPRCAPWAWSPARRWPARPWWTGPAAAGGRSTASCSRGSATAGGTWGGGTATPATGRCGSGPRSGPPAGARPGWCRPPAGGAPWCGWPRTARWRWCAARRTSTVGRCTPCRPAGGAPGRCRWCAAGWCRRSACPPAAGRSRSPTTRRGWTPASPAPRPAWRAWWRSAWRGGGAGTTGRVLACSGSGSWAPVGGWAGRSAGPWTPPATSSSWRRATRRSPGRIWGRACRR